MEKIANRDCFLCVLGTHIIFVMDVRATKCPHGLCLCCIPQLATVVSALLYVNCWFSFRVCVCFSSLGPVCLGLVLCVFLCLGCLSYVVSTRAVDCLERLVSEMTYHMFSGMLNSCSLVHSVVHLPSQDYYLMISFCQYQSFHILNFFVMLKLYLLLLLLFCFKFYMHNLLAAVKLIALCLAF